jgi:hypothetical protein
MLVSFKHELFPAVAGWNLLHLPISLELLAGSQQLHLVSFLMIALVFLKVRFPWHFVDLKLALQPRVPIELAPTCSFSWLFDQQSFEEMVKIRREEVHTGSGCCPSEGCNVVQIR